MATQPRLFAVPTQTLTVVIRSRQDGYHDMSVLQLPPGHVGAAPAPMWDEYRGLVLGELVDALCGCLEGLPQAPTLGADQG